MEVTRLACFSRGSSGLLEQVTPNRQRPQDSLCPNLRHSITSRPACSKSQGTPGLPRCQWEDLAVSSWKKQCQRKCNCVFFYWDIVDAQHYMKFRCITKWVTIFKCCIPFIVIIKYWLYSLCCPTCPRSLLILHTVVCIPYSASLILPPHPLSPLENTSLFFVSQFLFRYIH